VARLYHDWLTFNDQSRYLDHRGDVIVAYELDPLKPVCIALYGNGDIREISAADLRNQTVPAKATR